MQLFSVIQKKVLLPCLIFVRFQFNLSISRADWLHYYMFICAFVHACTRLYAHLCVFVKKQVGHESSQSALSKWSEGTKPPPCLFQQTSLPNPPDPSSSRTWSMTRSHSPGCRQTVMEACLWRTMSLSTAMLAELPGWRPEQFPWTRRPSPAVTCWRAMSTSSVWLLWTRKGRVFHWSPRSRWNLRRKLVSGPSHASSVLYVGWRVAQLVERQTHSYQGLYSA